MKVVWCCDILVSEIVGFESQSCSWYGHLDLSFQLPHPVRNFCLHSSGNQGSYSGMK
jgi:hypothetical protein